MRDTTSDAVVQQNINEASVCQFVCLSISPSPDGKYVLTLQQWFSNFYISRSPLNSDSIQMEPNGPVRVHLVPFVYCQSYTLVRVNLEPPKGTQKVPEIHFENLCFICITMAVISLSLSLLLTCLMALKSQLKCIFYQREREGKSTVTNNNYRNGPFNIFTQKNISLNKCTILFHSNEILVYT